MIDAFLRRIGSHRENRDEQVWNCASHSNMHEPGMSKNKKIISIPPTVMFKYPRRAGTVLDDWVVMSWQWTIKFLLFGRRWFVMSVTSDFKCSIISRLVLSDSSNTCTSFVEHPYRRTMYSMSGICSAFSRWSGSIEKQNCSWLEFKKKNYLFQFGIEPMRRYFAFLFSGLIRPFPYGRLQHHHHHRYHREFVELVLRLLFPPTFLPFFKIIV